MTELVADPPERIFHLAAQMDVRVSVADPIFDGDVNVLGHDQPARGRQRRRGRASSSRPPAARSTARGDGRELPFVEDAVLRPDSPYGQSKLSGEGYCSVYRRLHGVDTVALRLGNVYGPRQNPRGEAGVIAMFCGRLVEGRPVTVYGDGSQTRDYIYVDDLVDGLLAGGRRCRRGPYNVGTGAQTSVLDLVAVADRRSSSSRRAPCSPPSGSARSSTPRSARCWPRPSSAGGRGSGSMTACARTADWVRAEAAREREPAR